MTRHALVDYIGTPSVPEQQDFGGAGDLGTTGPVSGIYLTQAKSEHIARIHSSDPGKPRVDLETQANDHNAEHATREFPKFCPQT